LIYRFWLALSYLQNLLSCSGHSIL
jgi:hypothetical protein